MIDRTLSHFRIISKLGEGGMGEVYLAEDTRLDREVALKVLPETPAADPERLERLEREAKTLAALNHPSIVTIYSVESDEGGDFEGSFEAYDKALLLDPRDVFSVAHHIWTFNAVGDVEGARRIARRILGFPDASDLHIAFTHLIDLEMLGDSRPMAKFLRSHPDAELGSMADLKFLVPLFERRYEDTLAVLETLRDPIVAQMSVSPHSYVRARVLHAQGHLDAARSQAEAAVQELTDLAATMPGNARPFVARALMQAILGDEKAARADAKLAAETYPVERDALIGPVYVADGLRALAVVADSEELARELRRYLAMEAKLHYIDYLLLDPVFDRHRERPAIEALRDEYSLRSGVQ